MITTPGYTKTKNGMPLSQWKLCRARRENRDTFDEFAIRCRYSDGLIGFIGGQQKGTRMPHEFVVDGEVASKNQEYARLVAEAPDIFETLEELLVAATAAGNHDTRYPHRSDTDPMTSGCKFCRATAKAKHFIQRVKKRRES